MGKTFRRSKLAENFGCFEGYIERNGNAGFNLIRPDDIEYFRAWDKDHWAKRNRDGQSAHYSRRSNGGNKHYRHLTNKLIRNETRRKIALALQKDDWDDTVFPTDWDGKKFIWSVW